MENYTKYKLKSSDELTSVLNGRDNLFVIACNKCFKEFETVDEPDCGEFLKFAAEQGKNVTGSAKFDFLCNKMHTERKLQDLIPEGTENVVVQSTYTYLIQNAGPLSTFEKHLLIPYLYCAFIIASAIRTAR